MRSAVLAHSEYTRRSVAVPSYGTVLPVTTSDPRLARLDPRDRAYAEQLDGDERELVVATVTRYRRPERLAVGDPLPDLAAARLEDGGLVPLREQARERPLLLVFGSFT